ncbi:MAG: entericidin [Candidatus Accumulibacter sp.]|nr:entericidin [Accumulibacter sp.]MBA4093213.1 entericidin [Accumulibacter sp.]MBN9422384.1 entericidin A/B family lipoprotein [Accumulibacter sp.]
MFVKFSDAGVFVKKLTVLTLAVLAFSAAACNTVQGLGKDIEKGGEAIQKATK